MCFYFICWVGTHYDSLRPAGVDAHAKVRAHQTSMNVWQRAGAPRYNDIDSSLDAQPEHYVEVASHAVVDVDAPNLVGDVKNFQHELDVVTRKALRSHFALMYFVLRRGITWMYEIC